MKPHHLFPSAIACSCGKRFESSAHESNYGDERWSAPKSPTSALWLFLRHRAARLLNQCGPKKPHCADSVMLRCVFCKVSIDINCYGEHLQSGQCTPEASLSGAIDIYKGDERSTAPTPTPTFECYRCLDDDRFCRLDAAALVEHRHLNAYEMYIACTECRCKVPLCDAVGHAAFVHADRLANGVSVADMFCTAPPPGSTVESSSTEDVVIQAGPVENNSHPGSGPDRVSLNPVWSRANPPSDVVTFVFDIDDEQVGNDTAEIDAAPTKWGHLLECDVCGSTFRTKRYLSKHFRRHAAVQSHQCKACGNRYYHRGRLLQHLRHCGTPARTWPCDKCPAICKGKLLLAIHQRSHTGERPFSCTHCDVRTYTKDLLLRHMASIHSIGKYPCNQCSRVFAAKGPLRVHRMRHTGERPYECANCGRRFRIRKVLREHETTHEKRKESFHCEPCGKWFFRLKHLKDHCKRSLHKEAVAAAAAAPVATAVENYREIAAGNGCN